MNQKIQAFNTRSQSRDGISITGEDIAPDQRALHVADKAAQVQNDDIIELLEDIKENTANTVGQLLAVNDELNNHTALLTEIEADLQQLITGDDPEQMTPVYIDGGNVPVGGAINSDYPVVPNGKIHVIKQIDLYSGIIFKAEFIVDGVIVGVAGGEANQDVTKPTHIVIPAGQFLRIRKYNRQPIGAFSIYSTVHYAERDA